MTSKSSKLHRRSGLSVFLPAFLFIALLSSLWALASPIFSSPDENAHAAKAIALVRGEVVGHWVEGQRQLVVDLPQSYSYSPSIVCFAYHPDVTANCGTELGAATGNDWFASWVEAYNPIYYYLVGWPSLLFGGSAGIYAMRIASAIVSAVLLAWAFQVGLASRAARWLPVGLAFLASPMIVYLAGSVTPQGIEVASASALWIGLIRLLEHHRDASSVLLPRWYLWAIVTMSASLLALARALGPLWLVCLVGAALVIVGWQPTKRLFSRRGSYVWIAIIAAAGVFSLLWTLQGGGGGPPARQSQGMLP